MTDVISGKNRKRRASYKEVLPIFTQHLSLKAGGLICRSLFQQNEQRFSEDIQINVL